MLGRPDVTFPATRIAVIVDGCFWHSWPCDGTRTRSSTTYWDAKLERNRVRDALIDREPENIGFQ